MTANMGHFTFWISPSLSGIAERNRCNSQASRSNYRGYLHVLKIFIIIIIIDNRILNFLDCILIGIFHLVNVLNFHGHKNGGHFERWDAINTRDLRIGNFHSNRISNRCGGYDSNSNRILNWIGGLSFTASMLNFFRLPYRTDVRIRQNYCAIATRLLLCML